MTSRAVQTRPAIMVAIVIGSPIGSSVLKPSKTIKVKAPATPIACMLILKKLLAISAADAEKNNPSKKKTSAGGFSVWPRLTYQAQKKKVMVAT